LVRGVAQGAEFTQNREFFPKTTFSMNFRAFSVFHFFISAQKLFFISLFPRKNCFFRAKSDETADFQKTQETKTFFNKKSASCSALFVDFKLLFLLHQFQPRPPQI
jgi:hypothetical protein